MSWYEQWFDTDEYELVYQDRDGDEASELVDLIETVTKPAPGASVLDVGCGRGRHAVEFARRGYAVTGLDLSTRSLAGARRRAGKVGVDVRFIQGDMRDPVPEGFDLVVNLFTAFGYFDAHEDHQRAVDAMAGSVNPRGWMVQDFLNAIQVRDNLVAADVRTIKDWEIRQSRRIQDGRIKKRIQFKRGASSHAFEESVALLEESDFRRMYQAAGMEIIRIAGDYEGRAFDPASPRMIIFSRRA